MSITIKTKNLIKRTVKHIKRKILVWMEAHYDTVIIPVTKTTTGAHAGKIHLRIIETFYKISDSIFWCMLMLVHIVNMFFLLCSL